MDKTVLKSFAVESRKKLIEDTIYKLKLLGITEKEVQDPIEADGMQSFQIGSTIFSIYDDDIRKRKEIINEIENKGFENVVEEVAYTWFNRIIAIRYMEVNNFLPSKIRVLSSETKGKLDPDILTYALDIDLDYTEEDKNFIIKLKHEEQVDELFRFLFIKQCNKFNKILPGLFEKTDDYLELLLNISFTNEEGVVRQLIDHIPEEDFTNQVEIIGWLYQFYISERKDLVNNAIKSKPIKKEDIPAATQLFTPDWIVKYMVDNSLGRYWIERNENSNLKDNLEYYFDEVPQEDKVKLVCKKLRSNNISPRELRFFDPCMGSGHILVYAFDVFMNIYEELGYMEGDIPELILKYNLYGLDIDERAYQLAYFALMMKGRQYDKSIFKKDISPNVFAIKNSNLSQNTIEYIKDFDSVLGDTAIYLNKIFKNASEFGSLIQVDELNFDLIEEKIIELLNTKKHTISDYKIIKEIENNFVSLIKQAKVLSLKYEAVVTNPPYLNKYDKLLKEFTKKYYKDYSKDLFSIFIYRNFDFCTEEGYVGFMTPLNWMFIKNFEKLREFIINYKSLVSLIELWYMALWEMDAHVSVCTFVMSNYNYNLDYKGTFIRLSDFKGGIDVQNKFTLKSINEEVDYKYVVDGQRFDKIPGKPIAYWINDTVRECFNDIKLDDFCDVKKGLSTGDNNQFIKYWFEVPLNKLGLYSNSFDNSFKWFPINKGGPFRKWYGNNLNVVNWENNGVELKNFNKSVIRNERFYLQESLTWTMISSSKFGIRFSPEGFLFEGAGPSLFTSHENLLYFLGFLCSNVADYLLRILNPTMNINIENIKNLPIGNMDNKDYIIQLVKENIRISKEDWDSFEESWDFKKHPLINNCSTIRDSFMKWDDFLKEKENTLYNNEKYINKFFIEKFDLSDILSDVPEITLTSSDIDRDIKSFISYAVGCMFGRYSLDEEGLQFAGGTFDINNYSKFIPDDDNIIPVLDDAYFDDDIVGRFVEFVKTCFGEETLEENLDFIADSLANNSKPSREKIRDYLLKNFFIDHKKTYKNCPIYWQFSSGKENGFNCFVYMHRYEPSLVARIRTEYLHKTQRALEQAIDNCDITIKRPSSSNAEKNKATKEKNKLQKQLKETQIYDEALAHIANQNIKIDLDDGVKVNYAKFQNVEVSREGSKTKKINLLKKL